MSATCPNCGKTVRTGAKFCSHCGKEMPATVPLSQETSLPPEPASVPETEPGAPEPSPAEPQPAEQQSAEPQAAAPVTEICLHCGKTIRQGIKFCNYCGKPTVAAGAVPVTLAKSTGAVPPPPAAIPPMQPPAGAEAPKKKGRKKGCIVILIVLLAAGLLLVAAAFLALRGTFGDLQLPAPVEEFASRLGKATPTSEPTRTPKPTKTPTATETPEPTFTPTLTLTPTMTPTPEPEYTFYDSFETGLNDWWSAFGSIAPIEDLNAGQLFVVSAEPANSGIKSVINLGLPKSVEIGVTASLFDYPPKDVMEIRWTLDSLVSPAGSANPPAAVTATISKSSQSLVLFDTTNNTELGSCKVSWTIDDSFYTYKIRIENGWAGLYLNESELCSVGMTPADLGANGNLSISGNAGLDEVYIIEK